MGRGKWADAIRRVGLPLVFAAALVGFGAVMNHHYPIGEWLFVRYAGYWLCALLFVAACLSSGHAVVKRVLGGRVLPLFEQLAVSFAAGVYVFFLGMMLGGLLRLYGGVFFFALPVALSAAGARPFVRYLRRASRHLRGAYRRAPRPPPWGVLVHAFGLLGLLMVYVAILTPNNTAFDARWQHLGLAEHYAAAGAVTRFPEGWFIGAAPHLASFLYTWAFLLPKGRIFDHIELSAHVEYAVFAFGLIGIPGMVRRLVRPSAVGAGAYRYAWAARFLFPGIFLYDSSLCLGADHIASVFAVPIYVLLLRAWKELSPRACVLLSLALSGALLTKYTGALLMVAPAIAAVPLRALVLGWRAWRRRGPRPPPRAWYAGPLAALAAGLVFTAPHWIKNIVWYGDPLYPILHAHLRPRPWTADTGVRFDVGFMAQLWRPERTLKGLGQTLRALATFSFVPNDWEHFHGTTPVFGSLFTISLAALPFLKNTRRLWGLYLATHLGIFVWYWTHHQDRYLQAALPWMTAATVAVLALVWRQGLFARLAAGALVALQIVWGADVFFMPGHVFLGVPARAAIDLISRPPGKIERDRFVYGDAFVDVGKALPRGAKVLIHEFHPHLGVGAPSVTDCPYHQGGISYLRTPTPREVYDQLSGYGVTHLVYQATQMREPDVVGGELVFANFVHRAALAPRSVAGWTVAAMPKVAPPPGGAPDPVLVVTCGKGLAPGLYHLADLQVPAIEKQKPAPRPFKPADKDLAPLVVEAMAVAQDAACLTLPAGVDRAFVRAGTRDPFVLWVRR